MNRIDALEAAAKKATTRPPGSVLVIDFAYEEVGWGNPQRMMGESVGVELTDDDYRLIALADPATVLALIEMYRAAGRLVARVLDQPNCVACFSFHGDHPHLVGGEDGCALMETDAALSKVAALSTEEEKPT